MRKHIICVGFGVAALAMALLFVHFRAFGQSQNADPIFGTWKMDQVRSVNNRGGNHEAYTTQHIRTLTAEEGGMRNTLTNTPTSAPVYSYFGKFDGKDHPDPRAPSRDQTLAHWRLAPDVIVRLQKTNGTPSEWAIYTVSSDGNVLTSISWAPAHPELQDLEIFTKGN